MVSLIQLWLPIVLSAVFVFIASSLIHMVLKWHNSDYHGFSNEDEVRAAINKATPAPGMYLIPHCADMKDMAKPEMQAKFKEGPIAKVLLRAGSTPSMGKPLLQWFAFSILVSFFAAYLGMHAVAQGAPYLRVFQVVGTAAFMGYAFGSFPMGIWWGQPWGAVFKDVIDGLVYGLVTAGTFGWLWPR